MIALDGHRLYQYMMSGAQALLSAEQSLNEINFFPVPDGDTGTNLAFTMRTIMQKSTASVSAHQTLHSVSEAALAHAYGNSGMIFAQYLRGLAVETKDRDSLTLAEFSLAAKAAVTYAYQAVKNPVEGTILTVMKGWADFMDEGKEGDEPETLFARSVPRAVSLVEETQYGLKVLRKNKVVDAGAKAFMIFLQGVLHFIETGEKPRSLASDSLTEAEHKPHVFHTDIVEKNRYCSQFHMETQASRQEIDQAIGHMGDSLVIAQGQETLHIHLHTDQPDKVMARLKDYGEILDHQVDDMKLQSLIMNKKDRRLAIVTDSIADLPQSLIYDHTITVIPVNLICDSLVYKDKLTMTPEIFYDAWSGFSMAPTSAQPSLAAMEKALSSLSKQFDSILGIFVSEKMSGTYQGALRAARDLIQAGYPIRLVDSAQNSGAQGLLVKRAAQMAEAGHSLEEVYQAIEKLKKETRIYVMVKDLSYMLKGGRVSKAQGFLLEKIKLKPVISIDDQGKGTIFKKSRTQKKALAAIKKQVEHDIENQGIEEYALVYADDEKELLPLSQAMKDLTQMEAVYQTPISSVVGLNAGPGAVAVAYIKKGVTS